MFTSLSLTLSLSLSLSFFLFLSVDFPMEGEFVVTYFITINRYFIGGVTSFFAQ